jgi:hypothetical protein
LQSRPGPGGTVAPGGTSGTAGRSGCCTTTPGVARPVRYGYFRRKQCHGAGRGVAQLLYRDRKHEVASGYPCINSAGVVLGRIRKLYENHTRAITHFDDPEL